MEQRNNPLGVRVDARQIRPFVSVASITGKRQARGIAGAAVLFRHDMFQVERNEGSGGLRQPAVLTGVLGPAADQIASALLQFKQPAAKESAGPSPALWKRGPRLQ